MPKTDVTVELFYSGVWNDITADAYTRDPITITRGRPDESTRTPPSTLNLTLNNNDGKYSPRNPRSPLYGLIGRNTPIRVWTEAPVSEDFEDASLDVTITTNAGADAGWSRANDEAHTGTWSLKSNAIGNNQIAAVDLAVPANMNTLSFWYKVSSEAGFDAFQIQVDGVAIVEGITGEVDWTRVVVDVRQASVITFWYEKDPGSTGGSDASWVDSIEFSNCRFVGEVESWPQRWVVKGDSWAPITANGVMRRLNAPGTTKPARSALKRSVIGNASGGLLRYWPMEDGQDSDFIASGLSQGTPLSSVDVGFDADLVPAGSEGAVSLAVGSVISGGTGMSGVMTDWQLEFVAGWETVPTDNTDLYHIVTIETPGSTVLRWSLWLQISGGEVLLALYKYTDAGGLVSVGSIGSSNNPVVDGALVYMSVQLTQNGSDVDVDLRVGIPHHIEALLDTVTGVTLYAPNSLYFSSQPAMVDAAPAGFSFPYTGDAPASSLSHVAIWADRSSSSTSSNAIDGHAGETAVRRIQRLCDEDSFALVVIGDEDEAQMVGPQRAVPFLDLLQDAADADNGILYESRDLLGFAYRVGQSVYNQTAKVELDYSAGDQVAPPLEPVEDTDAIANDVTVKRYRGSSARVVKESGPLNVNEPADDPQGVGRYEHDVTLALNTDDQAQQHASWRVHLGTWDEARFPVVNMDLTSLADSADPDLAEEAASLDVGDRFHVINPPAWLPPEDIEQLAQGFTEVLASHQHTIAANATPARPYDVGVVETTGFNRLGTADTELNEALDTTETGVDIIAGAVRWIDKITYPSMFPFDVLIGGERMTVTDLTGTGLTQTMTVTRSVNGVVKSHAIGTAVQVIRPIVVAL